MQISYFYKFQLFAMDVVILKELSFDSLIFPVF